MHERADAEFFQSFLNQEISKSIILLNIYYNRQLAHQTIFDYNVQYNAQTQTLKCYWLARSKNHLHSFKIHENTAKWHSGNF
jgi:hypothetical protein